MKQVDRPQDAEIGDFLALYKLPYTEASMLMVPVLEAEPVVQWIDGNSPPLADHVPFVKYEFVKRLANFDGQYYWVRQR